MTRGLFVLQYPYGRFDFLWLCLLRAKLNLELCYLLWCIKSFELLSLGGMKSYIVVIQFEACEQYFPVVLFFSQ